MTNTLFSPLPLRSIELANRIVVSPMCQYSSRDGFANDWHVVHLGGYAVGGAGLIITEAAAVLPEGRITAQDLGIWKDEHIDQLRRITFFIEQQGSVPGIQLAHAGRKASQQIPWSGKPGSVPVAEGGWQPLGPSAIPFDEHSTTPAVLDTAQIAAVVQAFVEAAKRAHKAGFKVAEVHAAHGYLMHQFLSPISNTRTDQYGGSFENRTRLLLEVATAVRQVWPQDLPLFVRLSATDWVEGGWTADDTVAVSRLLRDAGVDLIDVSSGGTVGTARIPAGPGYQTEFAERVRKEAGVPSSAVGMITSAIQADHILRSGQADLVLLAREFLRQPHWPLQAAEELHTTTPWPPQYVRASSTSKTPKRPDVDYSKGYNEQG